VHCLLKVDAARLVGVYLERMGVSR
jgi:hypothetical protein